MDKKSHWPNSSTNNTQVSTTTQTTSSNDQFTRDKAIDLFLQYHPYDYFTKVVHQETAANIEREQQEEINIEAMHPDWVTN